MDPKLCPTCHQPIQDTQYFCANCGAKLKEPAPMTGVASQIKVYAISIFLPPLGLWPGVKYLRQKDEKAKRIGLIAIILTVLSTLVSIYFTVQISNNINNQVQKQMQQYNSFY